MEWEAPIYTFRSGTFFSSAIGVIGIDPYLHIYAGYSTYGGDPAEIHVDLTPAERFELGSYMVERWKHYTVLAAIEVEKRK